MWKQSDITRIAKRNECDIGFSWEIWQQIHSPGSEFFLNCTAKGKLNIQGKGKNFCIFVSRACAQAMKTLSKAAVNI